MKIKKKIGMMSSFQSMFEVRECVLDKGNSSEWMLCETRYGGSVLFLVVG